MIAPDQLKEALQEHQLWLNNKAEGRQAVFQNVDFKGLDLPNADFTRADLRGSSFVGANLPNADFTQAFLKGTNFARANLPNASFERANLSKASFEYASLPKANFKSARLIETLFQQANLSSSFFTLARCQYAIFRDTDLTSVDFRYATLTGISLKNSNLNGCIGNQEQIKSIFSTEIYPITYTATDLQIGCQNHKIEDWWEFESHDIFQMDGEIAVEFWQKWKDVIKLMIEMSPAER